MEQKSYLLNFLDTTKGKEFNLYLMRIEKLADKSVNFGSYLVMSISLLYACIMHPQNIVEYIIVLVVAILIVLVVYQYITDKKKNQINVHWRRLHDYIVNVDPSLNSYEVTEEKNKDITMQVAKLTEKEEKRGFMYGPHTDNTIHGVFIIIGLVLFFLCRENSFSAVIYILCSFFVSKTITEYKDITAI